MVVSNNSAVHAATSLDTLNPRHRDSGMGLDGVPRWSQYRRSPRNSSDMGSSELPPCGWNEIPRRGPCPKLDGRVLQRGAA